MEKPSLWYTRHVKSFRFTILLLNCLLTFGSYFSFDLPSVLQDQIQSQIHVNGKVMDASHFNLFYTVYAWSNMLMVIIAGFITDKLGNRVGVLLFSSLVICGQLGFALGAYFDSFWIMFAGRLVFGSGGGAITISQNAISAQYFRGYELALAFGLTLTASRAGSVLNFFCSQYIYNVFGLAGTLFFGLGLCVFGLFCALAFCYLDWKHEKSMTDNQGVVDASTPLIQAPDGEAQDNMKRSFKFRDILLFPVSYWLLCIVLALFYVCVFSFIADSTDFFQKVYTFSKDAAARISGIVYDVSLVLSPFMGGLVDKFGRRGFFIISGALFTLIPYLLFAFVPTLTPIVPMLILGLTYTISAAALWPSIPLLVPPQTVGSARR